MSVALHAAVLLYASDFLPKNITDKAVIKPDMQVVLLQAIPPKVVPAITKPVNSKSQSRASKSTPVLATQAAPAAPTAEDWAFASK
ncbi:MAG TPA: hypothetical protein PK702_13205, partial [Burkholderiaceae bacterium]|nr:hypothetical protein [Burkholderiaceae bacterium]